VLLAWDRERQLFVEKLQALGIPVLVMVIVPKGAAGTIQPGRLSDPADQFVVLETGRIEEGLAKLV
jgi:hypothetical protein